VLLVKEKVELVASGGRKGGEGGGNNRLTVVERRRSCSRGGTLALDWVARGDMIKLRVILLLFNFPELETLVNTR
jgi:hypothetical protein